MNPSEPDKVIRISKDEAMSMHVDDMLKRQMSMRGDPGVTREHRRAWYYQNWFVFALLGTLGAFAAWAVLEPFFDDELYIQGPITAIFAREELSGQIVEVAREKSTRAPESTGSITVKGEKILLFTTTREI